jgi:Fe-S oxidoreductase
VAEELFESIAEKFNPFQRPNNERMAWARSLRVPVAGPDEPIDLLYWIGCAGSFDPDGQSVARSMIKVLNHLGLDYRVLGTAERCTGDPARRLGEEGLFQDLASANREVFRRHNVRRILTHCPHCFNTFRNEYQSSDSSGPLADEGFEVIHHSQFLSENLASGSLSARAGESGSVTFHDPCYLGRGNGIVDTPRAVLASLEPADVVEMPRHGVNSFCCGAGGGSMWLDMRGIERIENIRFREAAATGAATIVTGCPFCKTMLEAARKADEGRDGGPKGVRVRDLAELVADATGL